MTMGNRSRFGFAAVALAAAALAGCGSGGSSSTTASAPPMTSTGSTPASASAAATVATAKNTTLGQTILVDGQGKTLYLFQKDTGAKSQCTGTCAQGWPPLTTKGAPNAGTGADGSLLGTTKRSDGTTQVTYAGHPLYYFVDDQSAGDVNGNGSTAFGAAWYAVQPSGAAATGGGKPAGSASSTSTSSSGGYGY
jgi:predicted lipoprotein with Yx(FWY)xxD motif